MLFRPHGGEAILTSDAVAVDRLQPVALTHKLIEGRLILLRGEGVAGLPGGCTCRFTPDRSVKFLRAIEVAAYPVEQVALARELVEICLIIRRSEAVTGNPGTGSALLEYACETGAVGRGIAVEEHRGIVLAGELIEGGLIIGARQAVATEDVDSGSGLPACLCTSDRVRFTLSASLRQKFGDRRPKSNKQTMTPLVCPGEKWYPEACTSCHMLAGIRISAQSATNDCTPPRVLLLNGDSQTLPKLALTESSQLKVYGFGREYKYKGFAPVRHEEGESLIELAAQMAR